VLAFRRGDEYGVHFGPLDHREVVARMEVRAGLFCQGTRAPFEAGSARRNGGAESDLGELWEEIAEAVSKVVDRLTFGELVIRARERRSKARPMYHI